MARDLSDYFRRRIVEEEKLAATATHSGVKARHAEFAEGYRHRLAKDDERRGPGGPVPA